jgi:hypothetical protein
MMAAAGRQTMMMRDTTMPDRGVEGWHQRSAARTTEQEGQQGVDINGMGHATASTSASSSAMMASGWGEGC